MSQSPIASTQSMDMQTLPLVCHPIAPLLQGLIDANGDVTRELALGRVIRLSTRHLTNIIKAQDSLFKEWGSQSGEVIEYLQNCNRLMSLSLRSADINQSFLMLVPPEVRDRIWKYVIPGDRKYCQRLRCELQENGRCDSNRLHKRLTEPWGLITLQIPALLLVSKQISEETMPLFYADENKFRVDCACQLNVLLSREFVRSSIRHLDFGLYGKDRLEAIALLRQCGKLESLKIRIGKDSTNVLSEPAEYYKKCGMKMGEDRLSDAMGVIELKGVGSDMDIEVKVWRFPTQRNAMEESGFVKFLNSNPSPTPVPDAGEVNGDDKGEESKADAEVEAKGENE